MLQLGGFFAQLGVGLLRALHRAGAGFHQAVVAGLLLLRELQIGFGGGDVGGALFDDRLLQRDLGIEVAHRGFGSRDIGVGLIERGAEIAIVDPGQQLSGLDRLVVRHQHLGEIAGDFRRHDGGIGFDIGVVGRFEVPAGGQIAVAEVGRAGDAERQGQREGCALDRLPI